MSNSMTLFAITQEQNLINSTLEENGGELTPELEEALKINEANFAQKTTDYAYTILKYKATTEMVANEIKRLTSIKRTCENIVDRMKERLLEGMDAFQRSKIDCGSVKISTRKSESVQITDESLVPDGYKVVNVEISKSEIKVAIKAGQEVPGACMVTNKSIQIR